MTDEPTYTREQVLQALNQAADDVAEIKTDTEEDRVNLVVGATMFYLTGEAETLDEVVALNWEGDVAECPSKEAPAGEGNQVMSISEEQLRESIDTIRKVSAELESSTLGLEYQAGKVFDLADAAQELANHLDPDGEVER